jgi:endo-1,4-beta-mannosidase
MTSFRYRAILHSQLNDYRLLLSPSGSQKRQTFDQSNGRQSGRSSNVHFQSHSTSKVLHINRIKAAKVNYIKLNGSGDGVPGQAGQSYLFWIGGY